MPRYRHLVTLAGAMLLIGGALGLVFAILFHGTPWTRVRGIVGGSVAAYLGVTLIVAGHSGRLPGWLSSIFGDVDLD